VVDIVEEAFKALNVHKSETVEICRGYMFEKLRHWLDATATAGTEPI